MQSQWLLCKNDEKLQRSYDWLPLCSFSISLGWDTKREAIFDKSRFVSDGFLFSMPFGFYSKLYIFDYDRDFVSFDAAKVRILFETRNSDKYTLYILYVF